MSKPRRKESRLRAIRKDREEKRAATKIYEHKQNDKKENEQALKTFSKKRDLSCTRKYRYKTKEAAEAKITEVADIRGTTARAYECTFCYGFHLTHKPDRTG